jgi:hypothetical protein
MIGISLARVFASRRICESTLWNEPRLFRSRLSGSWSIEIRCSCALPTGNGKSVSDVSTKPYQYTIWARKVKTRGSRPSRVRVASSSLASPGVFCGSPGAAVNCFPEMYRYKCKP